MTTMGRSIVTVAAVIAGCAALVAAQTQTPPRPPASTLTRPATPARAPRADGFLQRWLVLEPMKVSGQLTESAVRRAVMLAQGNDEDHNVIVENQLAGIPADGTRVTVGGETLAWHAVDTSKYNVNLYHFAYALGKPTSNVLFWAVTIVVAPHEMRDVRLAIGSNAASIWWLNDLEVIGIYNDRQTVVDDGVSPRVTLKAGPNVVRAAIVNAGGATDFCARFLDAHDAPITDLTVRLTAPSAARVRP
jgi:hypothetical protein